MSTVFCSSGLEHRQRINRTARASLDVQRQHRDHELVAVLFRTDARQLGEISVIEQRNSMGVRTLCTMKSRAPRTIIVEDRERTFDSIL